MSNDVEMQLYVRLWRAGWDRVEQFTATLGTAPYTFAWRAANWGDRQVASGLEIERPTVRLSLVCGSYNPPTPAQVSRHACCGITVVRYIPHVAGYESVRLGGVVCAVNRYECKFRSKRHWLHTPSA